MSRLFEKEGKNPQGIAKVPVCSTGCFLKVQSFHVTDRLSHCFSRQVQRDKAITKGHALHNGVAVRLLTRSVPGDESTMVTSRAGSGGSYGSVGTGLTSAGWKGCGDGGDSSGGTTV